MDNKSSNIKERVLQIAENKGIAKEKFFESIGMTYGNFKGQSKKTPLNSNAIEDILTMFPDISLEWLLMGKGEMLKSETVEVLQETETPYYRKPNSIPLVRGTAIGGFGNSNFAIEQKDVKDYYVIPKFQHKKVDFMIEVEGSSMYPKYNSGDVVACRVINEKSFIQWNKTHVVATKDQGIIIKRIKKGESGSLLMVSDNKDYDPFPVPVEEIEGMALVVGVIRLE